MTTRFPRDVLAKAFPGQPRMLAAFEDLITAFEGAVSTLEEAAGTASGAADTAQAALDRADARQPLSDTLTGLAGLPAEAGAIEQVGAGLFAVRPIDADDTASLLTREVADSRYLGADHPSVGVQDGELDISIIDLPSAVVGQPLIRLRMGKPITFTGGSADAATGATGAAVLTIRKNGSSAGTVTFSGSTGTVAFTSGNFTAGSLLEIMPPSPADATLNLVSITLTA